jgi:UDP-hydrolysing UDP-N-acetyl-D-glucosamine 2-epimerase
MPRTVCVVVTARPSYSRIKSALRAIDDHAELELQLVVAASALLDRFGDTASQMARDGFAIAGAVDFVVEGNTPVVAAKTTGLGIIEFAGVFDRLKPDVVAVIADRYEVLAAATAAAYMNICLAHVQGGEVTGSVDEKVRHAITKLANIHFVSNASAAERVRRMGEPLEKIYVTGCPSIDLAASISPDDRLDFDPFARYGGVGSAPDLNGGYVVVMQHPVPTEYSRARRQVQATLEAVHQVGRPALWFWPNMDAGADEVSKGIRIFREHNSLPLFHFFKGMSPEDFLKLIANCQVLIGNSSVGIREGAYLGVPVVNIGSREEGRERGPNVIDVDHDSELILEAVRRQIQHGRYPRAPIYGEGNAGSRIAEHLATCDLGIEKRITY